MINASELRLGNIVYTNFNTEGGKIPTVIDEKYFHKVFQYGGNEFYPIPLTSELLEKAGFVFEHDVYYKKRTDLEDWEEDMFLPSEFDFAFFINSNGLFQLCNGCGLNEYSIGKPIEHLHQLQNLYFALTSEELNIELVKEREERKDKPAPPIILPE